MKGRLRTGGFLIGSFLVMLVIKFSGFVPEGIFAYALAACFIMAAIELLCAGGIRKFQRTFYVMSGRADIVDADDSNVISVNFGARQARERPPAVQPDPPDFFIPAVEVGLLVAATIALIGGPFDIRFWSLITFPMSDAEVILMIVLSAVTDAVMFFVGGIFTRLGVSHRVKFLASISPKKTYEGYIGGIIGGLALLGIFYFVLPSWLPGLFDGVTNSEYVKVFAVVACPVIFVGDLLGSASKRALQIKDSNQFAQEIFFVRWLEKPLTGHGGYLDRFDSTCLCVCIYMLVKIIIAPSLWL